jgi:hypothetical protein
MAFAPEKHKAVQTGSHLFMAFAKKKSQTGSNRFRPISGP